MIDPIVIRKRIGENVSFLLKSRGISMAALAEVCNCTVQTIIRIRAAENDPAHTTVVAIADYFGVPTDDLHMSSKEFKDSHPAPDVREPVPA